MPAISSIFLSLALVLAVIIGPQTRAWTWGPSMLCLGIAVTAAMPSLLRRPRPTGNFHVLAWGALVVGWFAWRAWISPVHELGMADLMLLASAVSSFVVVRSIEGNLLAERILTWSIGLLLAANVGAVALQVMDPAFTPIFRVRAAGFPSGFYAHYNEAANYLVVSCLILSAAALFGRHHLLTRILWGLIAVAALAAIYFTRSRGGILALAAGAGTFVVASLMVGYRTKAKWFGPAIISVPVLAIGVGAFLFLGWQGSQEIRSAEEGVAGIMDNNSRLLLFGIAISCIFLHPIAGGGSRSYSWESFRFFESSAHGDSVTHKPEQVHNELLQAATDYGLAGATLLSLLLGAIVIIAVVRLLFSDSREEEEKTDFWRIAGLSAFAGMFVQSCFSFVFHLVPGVILLGICLAMALRLKSPARPDGTTAKEPGVKGLLAAAGVACLVVLFPLGWKSTKVTTTLWSTYFSKIPLTTPEARAEAMTKAIEIWPSSEFHQERAAILQEYSTKTEDAESRRAKDLAIADYLEAQSLHPYDPAPAINRANLLSQMLEDTQAEEAYDLAIHLQHGMEPAYRARFSLATHLMRKAIRLFSVEDPGPSLSVMENCAAQMERAAKEMHWVTADMLAPRVSVQESLGAAREANGDYPGALIAYDTATRLTHGNHVHYRVGLLYGKLAANAWNARKPGEALGYFISAKFHINLSNSNPQGVTPSQRVEYLAYLDQTIAYLQGAKIQPIAPPKIQDLKN